MQLHHIDAGAKDALHLALLQYAGQRLQGMLGTRMDLFRILQVLGPLLVFDGDQRHHQRVVQVVVDAKLRQPPHRIHGVQAVQVDSAFTGADMVVSILQRRQVQAFTATEVVINHRPRDVGFTGDLFQPCALQAPACELLGCRHQQAGAVEFWLFGFAGGAHVRWVFVSEFLSLACFLDFSRPWVLSRMRMFGLPGDEMPRRSATAKSFARGIAQVSA